MNLPRFLILAFSLGLLTIVNAASPSLPHLRQQGTAVQLIVDNQPFLFRGGELGNSTGEPEYLRQYWSKLKALNLNGLAAPVYWDVIEPTVGKFDFTTVDRLIADARENNMRLVLLWFGSWKNSMSCYAPVWVKRDFKRFPRSYDSSGKPLTSGALLRKKTQRSVKSAREMKSWRFSTSNRIVLESPPGEEGARVTPTGAYAFRIIQ